jgi:hypothetical protein
MRFLPLDYWSPVANLLELAVATLIMGTLTGANEKMCLFRSRFLQFLGDAALGIVYPRHSRAATVHNLDGQVGRVVGTVCAAIHASLADG